jgi:putative acetyltransferase
MAQMAEAAWPMAHGADGTQDKAHLSEPLIRPEWPEDRAAIHALLVAAFGGSDEVDLVARLRGDGSLLVSLVAIESERIAGRITGHIVASPIALEATAGRTAAALAPVAVHPDRQRQGIGTALVEALLSQLARRGTDLVFVLGDPAWYARFGFSAEAAAQFASPFAGPAFMVREIVPGALAATRGTGLRYAAAFAPFLPTA